MNKKIKLVKSSIVIAAVVSMFLIAASAVSAQPLNNINSDRVLELLDNDAITPEADETASCILASVISNLDALSECGDDQACRAATTFGLVTDILLCANPDDENINYFICLTDAIMDMVEVSSTCNGDKACLIQSMIPLIVKIINCQGQSMDQ